MSATAQFKRDRENTRIALCLALDPLKKYIEIDYGKRCRENGKVVSVPDCPICHAWFFYKQLKEFCEDKGLKELEGRDMQKYIES